jgi:hypothetical protein
MTFRYEDNWRSLPVNEEINAKVSEAENEGFGALNYKIKRKSKYESDPKYVELINKKKELVKQLPPRKLLKKSSQIPSELRNKILDVNSEIKSRVKEIHKTKRLVPSKVKFKKPVQPKIEEVIASAQMSGFGNDDTMGFGIKIKIKKPKITIGKKPLAAVAKVVTAPVKAVLAPVQNVVKNPSLSNVVKIVNPTTSLATKVVTDSAKVVSNVAAPVLKPINSIIQPIQQVATLPMNIAASVARPVIAPVVNTVEKIPLVGSVVKTSLSTAVDLSKALPSTGLISPSNVVDIAANAGVLKNIPVPTGYSETPIVTSANMPAPSIPSNSFTNPSPVMATPVLPMFPIDNYANRSSSFMNDSLSNSGNSASSSGYSSSSNPSQESENNDADLTSDDSTVADSEVKAPVAVPEVKKSNAPKVIGALASVGALYMFMKS